MIVDFVGPTFLWIALVVMVGGFGVMTLSFIHHWDYYGINKSERMLVQTSYLVIAGAVILVAAALALAYQLR